MREDSSSLGPDRLDALPHGRRTQYLFGRFSLDAGAHLLSRGGRTVPLSTKAVELLIHLVAKAPQVVSKAELMDCVWPHRIVEDNHLTHLVADLRRALGANRRDAIRTVHGVGFAFTLPVEARRATDAPAVPVAKTAWELSWAAGSCPSLEEEWPAGRVELAPGLYTVGRSPECGAVFASRTVSGRHARLCVESDAVFLEDLGSKNGTFLDGRRLSSKTCIPEGGVVSIGAVVVRLQRRSDRAARTETMDSAPVRAKGSHR
jgi:DNA-binding winged helix-turn-helix (wHTH) protein